MRGQGGTKQKVEPVSSVMGRSALSASPAQEGRKNRQEEVTKKSRGHKSQNRPQKQKVEVKVTLGRSGNRAQTEK